MAATKRSPLSEAATKSLRGPAAKRGSADNKGTLLDMRPNLPVIGGLALAGVVLILYVHHWSLTPSVLFLWFGWISILAAGYYLWTAGLLVAAEEQEAAGFQVGRSHADDLRREKMGLLKAIKEVEFDHLMGKMSDEDAGSIIALYRRRAIAILRELDADAGGDETLSIADKIERDIRARAEISGASRKAKARARADAQRIADRGKRSRKKRPVHVTAAEAATSEDEAVGESEGSGQSSGESGGKAEEKDE